MSPLIFACCICGYVIYDYENASWLNQFRVLYSSPEGIAITGVGLYDDPNGGDWTAPSNPTARWDDAGYGHPAHDQIGVLRLNPRNGRYGFPFHEACWSLLEKSYLPEPIPYKALFEVCRSLPFPSQGFTINWGHDFEGLVLLDNQDRYPWEDRFVEVDGHSELYITAKNDPYHVPEIQQLLYEKPLHPPPISYSSLVTTVADRFSPLPKEICIMIASNLSTTDALNARRASRSFISILYSQQFWASRFMTDADRSWLFESREGAKAQDWRWIYRRTNKANRTRGMQNRDRVWKLIQNVRVILRLRWTESPILLSPSPNPDSSRWLEATGDLRPEEDTGPYHNFNEGCRLFTEKQTSIPDLLSQIVFSVIRLGDTEYIAGMRFISSQGEAIQLGYWAEGGELSLNVTLLAGFNLAVGSRGVQAIQCITGDGQTSQWFGCPYRAPRTRRLAVCGRVTAIKTGFDGCKMVSLAVAESVTPTIKSESLRDSAFWYPKIPGISLYLNDDYFAARDSSTTMYQPLCWTMFGGPRGVYLHHLTGISVTCRSNLRGIEFHYNSEHIPIECRKLGRYKSSEYDEVIHFDIAGPSGEDIDNIKVYYRHYDSDRLPWFYRRGVLMSFKITTNRGRSYYFGQKRFMGEVEELVEKPIVLTPGTIATGFYWSQHENSITALGVISEAIGEAN